MSKSYEQRKTTVNGFREPRSRSHADSTSRTSQGLPTTVHPSAERRASTNCTSRPGWTTASITPSQHRLLLAIRGHHGSTPSVGDLADALQVRNNSVVGLLDRADAAGLTQSASDPSDGRRRLVSLGPAGRAVLERLSDHHREQLRSFHDEMSQVLRELD